MRKRRNAKNTQKSISGYISKYFGTDIGRILAPNENSIQNCEYPYVSHPEAEAVLGDMLIADPYKDKSLMFTGLTGSGKTTILRHVLGLKNSLSSPYMLEDKIIIPIDFNRLHNDASTAILSNVQAAVNMLCQKYGIDYPDTENQSFYEYIVDCKTRIDTLNMDLKFGRKTTSKQRLEKMVDTKPSAYVSFQLQYVLDQTVCKVKLVVLVIDNLEAFVGPNTKNLTNSAERYIAPVIESLKLADCINKRSKPTSWSFNMVISCRHHIWRIMKGEYSDNTLENPLLQSFVTTEEPYDLTEPVKANDIIKKRSEVFSRMQRDPEKWNSAVNVVKTILSTMENKMGDFVLQIELKDLRKSMIKIREITTHIGLQKVPEEKIVEGTFQIGSPEQFDLTRVNIVRVMGLGSNRFYSNSSSIIPNLLFNNPMEGMELYPLLTLKYFLRLSGYLEPTWDNSVLVPQFFEMMEYIFGRHYQAVDHWFKRSVEHLICSRLLLRSADQPQSEVPGLSPDEIKTIEKVYVSGAAVVMWKELAVSSALFQLFMDDIWLPEELDYFDENGNDIEHCLKYLEYLFHTEKEIFHSACNISDHSRNEYLNCFGKSSISSHLISGLIASLNVIVESKNTFTQSRVRKAQNTLQDSKSLVEKINVWEQER